jgi:hypothetical protein
MVLDKRHNLDLHTKVHAMEDAHRQRERDWHGLIEEWKAKIETMRSANHM